jgi:hypothetical protein
VCWRLTRLHLSHSVVDLHNCVKKLSPSLFAIRCPNKLEEVFGYDTCNIHLKRLGGPPGIIFNCVLAMLRHHLDHLEQIKVDCAEVNRADLRCAVKFYEASETSIKELLIEAIGNFGKWGFADCSGS